MNPAERQARRRATCARIRHISGINPDASPAADMLGGGNRRFGRSAGGIPRLDNLVANLKLKAGRQAPDDRGSRHRGAAGDRTAARLRQD
jgi:hypothetical protein